MRSAAFHPGDISVTHIKVKYDGKWNSIWSDVVPMKQANCFSFCWTAFWETMIFISQIYLRLRVQIKIQTFHVQPVFRTLFQNCLNKLVEISQLVHSSYHPRMRVGNVFGHVCLSVCLSVCVSVCLSVCVSVCVSVCSGYNFWTAWHKNFILGMQVYLDHI